MQSVEVKIGQYVQELGKEIENYWFFGKSKIFAKINLNFSEICAIMIFEQGKLSNLHRKRREYGYEQGTDRAFFAPL